MESFDAVEDDIKPRTQPHLMTQDATTVDATKLTALTPEVVRLGFLDDWTVMRTTCRRPRRLTTP